MTEFPPSYSPELNKIEVGYFSTLIDRINSSVLSSDLKSEYVNELQYHSRNRHVVNMVVVVNSLKRMNTDV